MDVIAAKDGCLEYIQVKSDRRYPFKNFPPAEREALLEEAERAGAIPLLVWWPPDRLGPRWLPGPDEWPASRAA